jgi:acetolactate synthase-1/2/3 large subunit
VRVNKPRGADALAQTRARAGVKYIFTVSGNHIMPVFDIGLTTNPLTHADL